MCSQLTRPSPKNVTAKSWRPRLRGRSLKRIGCDCWVLSFACSCQAAFGTKLSCRMGSAPKPRARFGKKYWRSWGQGLCQPYAQTAPLPISSAPSSHVAGACPRSTSGRHLTRPRLRRHRLGGQRRAVASMLVARRSGRPRPCPPRQGHHQTMVKLRARPSGAGGFALRQSPAVVPLLLGPTGWRGDGQRRRPFRCARQASGLLPSLHPLVLCRRGRCRQHVRGGSACPARQWRGRGRRREVVGFGGGCFLGAGPARLRWAVVGTSGRVRQMARRAAGRILSRSEACARHSLSQLPVHPDVASFACALGARALSRGMVRVSSAFACADIRP
jgi:hypothetical protein